jgi:hypothetical protein
MSFVDHGLQLLPAHFAGESRHLLKSLKSGSRSLPISCDIGGHQFAHGTAIFGYFKRLTAHSALQQFAQSRLDVNRADTLYGQPFVLSHFKDYGAIERRGGNIRHRSVKVRAAAYYSGEIFVPRFFASDCKSRPSVIMCDEVEDASASVQ